MTGEAPALYVDACQGLPRPCVGIVSPGLLVIEATAISGHSTRIGKAQDCVAAGIGIGAIMRDGGRRSEKKAAHC
ncbi:MAG: hypothetical protein VCF08_05545 [Alphaproteobacteria bacterium]